MDLGRRRAGAKTGVVAGSVWESRMRSDEVRGGIKVFNGDDKAEEPAENGGAGGGNAGRTKRAGPVGSKRKTSKPESGDGPVVQVPSARARGELSKNCDEVVEKKSPAVGKKGKRDAVPGADQAVQRSPVQVRRSRSEGTRWSVEKSSVELRKVKSDSAKVLGQSRRDSDGGKSEENAVRLSTASSQPPVVVDGSRQEKEEEEEQKEEAEKEVEEEEEEEQKEEAEKEVEEEEEQGEEEDEEEEEEEKEVEEKEAIDGSADGYEEDPVGESRSDEIRQEVISSNVIQVKSAPKEAPREDGNNSNDNAANNLAEEEEEEEEEFSEGLEAEEGEGEFDEDPETEPENKRLEIKEMVVAEEKTSDVAVKEETKPVQVTEKPKSIPPIVKKRPSPVAERQAIVHRNIATPTPSKIFTSPSSPSSNIQHKRPQTVPRRSSLYQNLVEGEEGEEGGEEEEFSEGSDEEEEKEGGEGEFDEGAEAEPENKRLEIKEMVVAEKKTSDVPVKEETKPVQVTEKPKSIPPIMKKRSSPAVEKQARVHRNIATPTPSKIVTSTPSPSSNVQHKQPQIVLRRSSLHQNFATKTNSFSEKYQSVPQRQNKLQSLVDLVMWRDASRSTLIFGLGTFVVISSSYTKDISFSSITVISYLGLFYLAAIFLYRSIICRGYVDIDDSSCVLREEEAIWLLKVVLPYLNEFLLKLKALFSGDPGTTMKLAVLLFVLARCGNSITIWKMAKFGFFGAFTVPKVCSSYSGHITAYGKFWIRRFRDAWNSCSHKKAVAVGIFTLVWNLCSVVARIWAVFMLYVAFRYYQQNLVIEDWVEDDECADDKCQGQVGGTKNSCGPKIVESSKGKKAS